MPNYLVYKLVRGRPALQGGALPPVATIQPEYDNRMVETLTGANELVEQIEGIINALGTADGRRYMFIANSLINDISNGNNWDYNSLRDALTRYPEHYGVLNQTLNAVHNAVSRLRSAMRGL